MKKFSVRCEYEDRYSPVSKGEVTLEFLGSDTSLNDLLKTCQEIMYLESDLEDPVVTKILSVGSKELGRT